MHDLIVVGGGPAGATCARRAALRGLDVLLLDRSVYPREKPCGGALSPRVSQTLDFDIAPVVDRDIRAVSFHTPSGRGFVVVRRGLTVHMVTRSRFDHYLLHMAEDAGVEVIQEARVVAIERTRDAVRALCLGDSHKSHMLIGADGVNGIVARATGIRHSWPSDRVGLCISADVPMDPSEIQRITMVPEEDNELAMHIYFGATRWGYAWCFPKRDNISIGVGCRVDRLTDLRGEWTKFVGRLEAETGVRISLPRTSAHRVPLGPPHWKLVSPKTMLVGDAAGLVSPITGEGIFYGVASGLLAADTAVETVKTRSPRLILTYEQKIGELLRPELNVLRFVAEKLYGSKRTLQTVCDVAAVDPVVRDLIIDLVIGAKPAQSVKSRLLKQMLIHHPLQTIKIGLG